jgi:hypothetical protein
VAEPHARTFNKEPLPRTPPSQDHGRALDARFHWFLHFLVGASAALLLMALIAWRRRAAAPFPLLWILAGHLFARL